MQLFTLHIFWCAWSFTTLKVAIILDTMVAKALPTVPLKLKS